MGSSLEGDAALLLGAALLTVGALLSGVAERVRAPGLLLFLGLGMVVADEGLGLVRFDDPALAQSIGVVALVVILFEGGLSTSLADVRRVAAPAGLLATVGVGLTAAVVAGGVLVVTDLTVTTAALIGAVVASTDAAAVFAVLRRAPAPRRVTALLEAESGANDPLAVVLTVGILATWQGEVGALDWVVFGVRQLVGGIVIGLLVGGGGLAVLRRLRLDRGALYPVLALGVAGLAYGLGALVGASGFLAVYLAGLVIGTSPRHRRAVQRVHEGLATVAQISLFLLLGILVFPSELWEVAGTGLAVALVLTFVARPLAVAVCVPWFGYRARELALVSWGGLRGAVPIVLATFPLTVGHPDGSLVFDIVFFVVLASATLQGLTLAPVARALGFASPGPARAAITDLVPLDAVGMDVIELELGRASPLVGRAIGEVALPEPARVSAILRGDEVVVPTGETALAAEDVLLILAPTGEELSDALVAWATGPTSR